MPLQRTINLRDDNSIITILTHPISVNKLYQGRRYLTSEGKQTKFAMAMEIKAQRRSMPLINNVKVRISFYFKDKRGMDIDGALKGLLDCCKGILWIDDRYITDLYVHKRVDKDHPRTEIEILP